MLTIFIWLGHRCAVRWVVAVALTVGLASCIETEVAAAQTVVAVEVHNPTSRTLQNVPVSFGQAFKRGDVGHGVGVRFEGRSLPAQVDVRRHHEDGSIRFAVVSLVLDKLPAGETATLALTDGEPSAPGRPFVSAAELLGTDFDATVTLTFPDGKVRSVSARELLRRTDAETATWLRGPTATEWLLSGPPTDSDAARDEDLTVQFQVRAYAGGKRVRTSVVVENCRDDWAGNIRYDVAVTVAGQEAFARKAVDHRRLSRWRKVFWWGGEPEVHVTHDLSYLSATGALPHYDSTLAMPEPSLQRDAPPNTNGSRWDIMGHGSLTAYMPTTGGRPEIAPYPAWTVRYLLSMDRRAKALVLANGELAGSWPIHVRARQTGRIMTIDQRPNFWLNGYRPGQDKPEWKPDRHTPNPDQVRLSPDLAHQGSFAYVPYLVTGDFYHLEEAYFWANYCLLATWSHPRRDAEGIVSGQIRGNAWALRNIADAAWIAPDDAPEGKYFDEKIRNNLADRIGRMYGPPEHSRLGFWGERTVEDARIQHPANPNWLVTAPWEHDYLIWSLHHLAELGYVEAARPRDFLLRWRVGTMTHAPDFDPRLAAPYRFVVGQRSRDGKGTFYEDWGVLGRENARLSEPRLPSPANDYAYSARAAVVCGVDGRFPQAEQALRWIEAQFSDLRQTMTRNPSWAIVPGGAAGRDRE
ncbi:MAG: hypothetical protein JXB62_08885 [Pirellulales bacterium]|nr:hypothetical protein [Pirellulales bacterium]